MKVRRAHTSPLDAFLDLADVYNDLLRGKRSNRRHRVPDWVNDDEKLAAFLAQTFPPSAGNGQQQAKNWALIILLYFRARWSTADVAKKLAWKKSKADRTIQRIRLAMQGLRQDGKPRTGRPKGRPRKSRKADADV